MLQATNYCLRATGKLTFFHANLSAGHTGFYGEEPLGSSEILLGHSLDFKRKNFASISCKIR